RARLKSVCSAECTRLTMLCQGTFCGGGFGKEPKHLCLLRFRLQQVARRLERHDSSTNAVAEADR
ncbi:MAG UNVERIFIED_CONTAM: hypothetical protein LVR18_51170, partial [Planctomycetaceae bacterium]